MGKLHIMVQTSDCDLIVVEQEWQNTALVDRRKWYAEAKHNAKQQVLSAHPGKRIAKTTIMGEDMTDDEVLAALAEEVAQVQHV